MEKLKAYFKDKSIRKVLDIGTGTGDFITILNDVFGDSVFITGTDPGQQWLDQARERFPQNHIDFKKMEGEKLLFDDASFDLVSISNALHHLRDISASIAEMKRVLKPGGYIVVNELHSDELTEAQQNNKMLHHFKSYTERLNGITHNETWSMPEILQIVSSQGIEVKLSFSHERDPELTYDEKVLDEKYQMMVDHLSDIEGKPEHEQMKAYLPVFKERLQKYGFQRAGQLMIVGQFC